MRKFLSFQVSDVSLFKIQLLRWCARFSTYCMLDSNQWQESTEDGYNQNELLVAAGSIREIIPAGNSFEMLKKFHDDTKDWLFGYLSYDLKNETENLSSKNYDGIELSNMQFFQPEFIFRLRSIISGNEGVLEIQYLPQNKTAKDIETIFQKITRQELISDSPLEIVDIKSRIPKQEYIQQVNTIKNHIHRGDIYEMNYCMEFFSDKAEIAPEEVFLKLSEASKAPFSAFYRRGDKYLMCASPERFLKKSGNKIISQPIKGTARRGNNYAEDLAIKKLLAENEKEKSENVMIVDLVRNDLSKSCNEVAVEELFGVYSFKQLHQMISTVSGELRSDVHFIDAVKNSFPMGSMTGAPKVRAMELIEEFEKTKRGLYSGAVGYITPEGDFDFNVVIRSILYNQSTKYLSFQVGSAITANSIPENEYEECLLKAKGMFEALDISDNLRFLREKNTLIDIGDVRKKENLNA